MTEAQLLEAIETECDRLMLLHHHCPDSRRCDGRKGFPDLVIAGPQRVIYRELKSEGGDTSADQDLWAWTLTRAGADWSIWRPIDLVSGEISHQLDELARTGPRGLAAHPRWPPAS